MMEIEVGIMTEIYVTDTDTGKKYAVIVQSDFALDQKSIEKAAKAIYQDNEFVLKSFDDIRILTTNQIWATEDSI